MSKKKDIDDYKAIEKHVKEYIKYMQPMYTSTMNPTSSQKGNGDRLVEAENAGKQAEAEKYRQDMADMRRLMYQLHLECDKNRAETEKLKNLFRATKKIARNHKQALKSLDQRAKKHTKYIKELQIHNEKSKKKSEKLSEKVSQIQHIISCISFLFGNSSMSESLKGMVCNWNKEMKRLHKKQKHSNCAVIDATYREVD